VVAFEGDAFFPPKDVEADAALVPAAEFRVTGSVWGHFTMFNLRPQDTEQIDALYAEILAA
jgi:homoserine acetyltransferase